MTWQIVLALMVAIPIILLPVAYVWYLNIGALRAAMKARARRPARVREEA